ncbi:MAG: hypothetical protein ACO249_06050, partial [Candidatus Nanopelagicales bacterium]
MKKHITEELPERKHHQAEGEASKSDGDKSQGASSEKKIRQAVYDIRYRARREDVDLRQAYSQYMSHTSMPANEKVAVREKLGLGPGGQVKEEAEAGKFYLRVDPTSRKTGEK